MLCKCQVRRFHPTPRCSVRLRRHVLMPGHQIARPVSSQHEHRERAHAVHFPAGWSGEQIVVQINQLGHEPDTRWDRVAKIAATPRIEQPLLSLVAATQPDIDRLIGIPRPADIHHPDSLDTSAGRPPRAGRPSIVVLNPSR